MKTTQMTKGFVTTRIDYANNQIMETKFAMLDDGSVLVSEECKFSHIFNHNDWKLTNLDFAQIKLLGAEFIGCYKILA